MRAIVVACVCVAASGCELYFGPSTTSADDASPPDAAIVIEPDAKPPPARPDPPAQCSNIAVYVPINPGDPRAPFLIASLRDALAYYHIPLTTDPPAGLALTIQLAPSAATAIDVPTSCMEQIGGIATIADDRSRSNDEIVANALHGLGVLFSFPPMLDAGDCMNDTVVAGCTFGRATTVASDPCGTWEFGAVDEAQMLATGLGCP